MNQNMQKMLLKKFHLTNLASPMFRNDDIIKNGLPKKYLPKTFLTNSTKNHKFSKKFIEKQKIGRHKMEMVVY